MDVAFWNKLNSLLSSGGECCCVTVLQAKGSTPRGAGSKMLVEPDGTLTGTIGGGCPEGRAWGRARQDAHTGRTEIFEAALHSDGSDPDGMVCGGDLKILVEPLLNGKANMPLWRLMTQWALQRQPFMALLETAPRSLEGDFDFGVPLHEPKRFCWCKGKIYGRNGEEASLDPATAEDINSLAELYMGRGSVAAAQRTAIHKVRCPGDNGLEEIEFMAEAVWPAPHLVIAGAGHVSRPLCKVAATCGYQVTVVDDRPEFADKAAFPEAYQVLSCEFTDFFRELTVDANTSVVLVTRGHSQDEACLVALMNRFPGYLGMIGSRRRTAIVLQKMLERGATQEWVDSVFSPIGLDTGGETPGEIAVGIVAEILSCRYQTSALQVSLRKVPKTKRVNG